MRQVDYILGHSDSELRRLMLQSAVIRPITERLLHESGIEAGMRVLDVGSGTGDVAMLAAELVGPRGSVVGIDRSADALREARKRAKATGHSNIEYIEGSAEDFSASGPFDLAIGRYVLIHQADPTAFIRAVASHVRPGGIVAFHEIDIYSEARALPPVPLWTETWSYIVTAFASVMTHPDAGGRMIAHFEAAGLGQPQMFAEVPVGAGRESPLYSVLALSIRNLLPQLEKIGAATAAEVDVETLERRLGEAVSRESSQMLGPTQFCGWSRRSERRDH